jgi:hypothetical protein
MALTLAEIDARIARAAAAANPTGALAVVAAELAPTVAQADLYVAFSVQAHAAPDELWDAFADVMDHIWGWGGTALYAGSLTDEDIDAAQKRRGV